MVQGLAEAGVKLVSEELMATEERTHTRMEDPEVVAILVMVNQM